MELATGPPKFSIDTSSLGEFLQRMTDFGLVFDINFTDNELARLPDWFLFDQKITAGISSISPPVVLPSAGAGMHGTVNGTVWTFVKLKDEAIKRSHGRRKYFFNPPLTPPTPAMFNLDVLINEFGIENAISRQNNAPVPRNLIVISM
jgi:hypothetical protein